MEITIRDTGIGIEESRRRKKASGHQSTALQAIRERLEVLGREHGISQPLEIKEWKTESGETGGTAVVVSVKFVY
ncbi:MAG: hypothetical protein J5I98_06530 [Phaeodactylibacter sp.]|nr:hypothetical protein [Phaeodactylibacter sp.]